MSKGPCPFKEADIRRLYRAAKKEGVQVQIRYALDGSITATPVKAVETTDDDGTDPLWQRAIEELKKK